MPNENSTPSLAGMAGLQLLGGGVNLIGDIVSNRQNRKLAEYSYQKNLEQWNRQNAYNHPSQQMARLREAGLNPNLVYGTGTVGNTVGGSPQYDTPAYKLDTSKAVPDAMATLGAYQQIQAQRATIDNINAQTKNTNADIANKAIQNELLKTEAASKGINLSILKSTEPYQVDIIKNRASSTFYEAQRAGQLLGLTAAQINQVNQDIKNKQTQNEIMQQEKLLKTFEAKWAEKGITKSDSLPVRILSRTLDQAGISLESAYQAIESYIKSIPDLFKQ